MLGGKRILAVVPARSGSKGIAHKNIRSVNGISLIGWAGITLEQVPFLDARVISTDSAEYAAEGRRYALDAPFLRPPALSTDSAGAVETVTHALLESERHYRVTFDVVLIVEPTSPLRQPQDIERATRRLIESAAHSVVVVSPVDSKFHPFKLLMVRDGKLRPWLEEGGQVQRRQELPGEYYWRNGVCYALTRHCLVERQAIFTENTLPLVLDRPIINIDAPMELQLAGWLLEGRADH